MSELGALAASALMAFSATLAGHRSIRQTHPMSHVFIINGDITKLACDAWLLPSDRSYFVTTHFAAAAGLAGAGRLEPERRLPRPDSGCFRLHESTGWREPDIWLGDVGRTANTDVNHFADQARSFVSTAAKPAHERAAAHGQRPLLALNVLGSGEGGKRSERLALLRALLPALSIAATDSGARPMLVCSTTPVALRTGRSDVAARGSPATASSGTASGAISPRLARS